MIGVVSLTKGWERSRVCPRAISSNVCHLVLQIYIRMSSLARCFFLLLFCVMFSCWMWSALDVNRVKCEPFLDCGLSQLSPVFVMVELDWRAARKLDPLNFLIIISRIPGTEFVFFMQFKFECFWIWIHDLIVDMNCDFERGLCIMSGYLEPGVGEDGESIQPFTTYSLCERDQLWMFIFFTLKLKSFTLRMEIMLGSLWVKESLLNLKIVLVVDNKAPTFKSKATLSLGFRWK